MNSLTKICHLLVTRLGGLRLERSLFCSAWALSFLRWARRRALSRRSFSRSAALCLRSCSRSFLSLAWALRVSSRSLRAWAAFFSAALPAEVRWARVEVGQQCRREEASESARVQGWAGQERG